jgi:F0F1-type ATP synthase delta subunit
MYIRRKEKDFLTNFFVYIRDNKPTGMIEEIVKEYLKHM